MARWERIFREKFADPEYYGAQPPATRSSLAPGFRPQTVRTTNAHVTILNGRVLPAEASELT